jgi:hypothetical protein
LLLHHWLGFFGHNGRFSPLLVLRQAATKSAPCRSEFLHIQAAGGEIELSNSDLDKDAGKVSLQRKVLFWRLKPVEAPLSDVSDIKVDTAVDRASGVEVCHTILIRNTGEAWALPAADKKEAEINASAIRNFLGRRT